MNPLLEKMRKARESAVDFDGHRFTIRRPTDFEAAALHRAGGMTLLTAVQFVVGWDLLEIDLVPGGTSDPVPFDAEVFAEWVQDQPDLWSKFVGAIGESYKAYTAKSEEAEKN